MSKIVWGKALGLLGATGAAGGGAGYGAASHNLGKAINQMETEMENMEQDITDKAEKIDRLTKENNQQKAQHTQDDKEIADLKVQLREKIENMNGVRTEIDNIREAQVKLQTEIATLRNDADHFIQSLNNWNQYNKQRLLSCQWNDMSRNYWQTKRQTFKIGEKSATLEFTALECPRTY